MDAFDPGPPSCLVLDVRMPGMSGLELQEELAAMSPGLPVIVLTGHGDVPMAVRAMKVGAFDFIEKPFRNDHLLDRVQKAVRRSIRDVELHARDMETKNRIAQLTPREHQVLELLIASETNKTIAHHLGVSEKTVEFHRANVMRKMKAKSLVDLVINVQTQGQPRENAYFI